MLTRVSVAACSTIALLAASCGGDDQAREDSRAACIQRAEVEATAQLVSEALDEGRLGTVQQVSRELHVVDSPGFGPASYAASGRLRACGRARP